MENEEKNIQSDIEENQEQQEETLETQDFQEIEDVVKETENIEEVSSLEENLQEQDEFSFLDALDNAPIEENVEPKEEKKENKQGQNVVTVDEDFQEDVQNEELITVRPVKFQQFEEASPNRTIKKNLDIMQDISMHVSVELGRTKSSIREVMEMKEGSVVELDKIAGEQVEIFVNDKLVAKGEVIVIEDKFGVRITSTNIQKQV